MDVNITVKWHLSDVLAKQAAELALSAVGDHRSFFAQLIRMARRAALEIQAKRDKESARAELAEAFAGAAKAAVTLSGIIIPERKVSEGVLVKATSTVWGTVIEHLKCDWQLAYQIPAEKWEEIVAGAFHKSGYEVVLTPRSRDRGRDVIATRKGIGCIKIIGSVKAYKPGNLVRYDDVRALLGVMSGERDTSKGIIATTSDFPPNIMLDPFIKPFVPYRLELMNGEKLREWLAELVTGARSVSL